ncbi:RDD family protein [Halolamina sp. CBA1230]|uniref:RDD family protein n=1 Tax=Halolamina sp. CBA1230 TaxID=1853690 RepID=UPI0009A1DF2A|nr:RDD family protein [Halolamina sp. CBA1230]QKY18851.1 RDD family protein [Halolamina sp. CBA1230]
MDRPAPRLGTEGKTFGQRVGALLLDLLLVGVTFGVVAGLATALAFVLVADPTSPLAVEVAVLVLQSVTTVVGLAYFVYTEGAYGQTLGKRAVGLVVVTEDGEPIGYGDALVRNVLRVVDALPAFFLLGAVLIVVTDRGQRVGDLAAETVVVEAK